MDGIKAVRGVLRMLMAKCQCDTLDQCGKDIFQNMNRHVEARPLLASHRRRGKYRRVCEPDALNPRRIDLGYRPFAAISVINFRVAGDPAVESLSPLLFRSRAAGAGRSELRCQNLWHPTPANFRFERRGRPMASRAGRAAAVCDPLRRRTARSTRATSLTNLIQYLAIRLTRSALF